MTRPQRSKDFIDAFGDGIVIITNPSLIASVIGLSIWAILTLVVLCLWLIWALAELSYRLYRGWHYLVARHPRTMLVIHLLLGMAAVAGGLYLAGFGLEAQIACAALVPISWGWLWLTRRSPMILTPINAALVGGGLWLIAQQTRSVWLHTWSRLTAGIPLVGDLAFLGAVLPMLLWMWTLTARRWPRLFRPLNLLALGVVACFLLMRVWTDWKPLWEAWAEPVPLLSQAVGWLIFLLPLGVWLWFKGQARWPLPFIATNLLIFGGLLGLASYHTQPVWLDAWCHWMAGLPFVAAPILTISLSPITLWGWSQVSRRWTKVFIIPNLLLTGGIIWLILDRTRPLWGETWRTVWGEIPLDLDLAFLMLILPLAVWAWRQGGRRWSHYWGAARAVLWGGVLWWIAQRTHDVWYEEWTVFAGQGAPDPALLALLAPPLLWSWPHLHRRWPRVVGVITWTAITLLLVWTVGRLLPESTATLRIAVALLPLLTWSWFWLLRRHPRVGWVLALLSLGGLGLFMWLVFNRF